MTSENNHITAETFQLDGTDYTVLRVAFDHLCSGVTEYIKRDADVETVAEQLEWIATKLRAIARDAAKPENFQI